MPDGTKAPESISKKVEPMPGFTAKLEKVRTLMSGTDGMREAGNKYLPIFEGESPEHYENRKAISLLFNAFEKTVCDMTGRVFEKPVILSEETDQRFHDWAEDVDLADRDLNNFAKQVFMAGMQSGIEYLMVDAPMKTGPETIASARSNNLRPYIIHIPPESVLGWQKRRINNKHTITQFRFMEQAEIQTDEFTSAAIDQIRVLDLIGDEGGMMNVRSRCFRKNDKGDWVQYGDDVFSGMDKITIVPFYANRCGFFIGKPPLENQADVNIIHWQSSSDQRNIVHFTRIPILFAKGLPNDAQIKISASQVTMANDPEADLKFVEHTGKAIAAGQKDLEHLEFYMETLGLQLIVAQGGPQTATGENRNDRKETSRLAMMADSLKDALEQCFRWMGEYDNIEFLGEVQVYNSFGALDITDGALQLLLKAAQTGKISRETFWAELVRRGFLPETFDAQMEIERLELEQAATDEITDVMEDEENDDDDEGGV